VKRLELAIVAMGLGFSGCSSAPPRDEGEIQRVLSRMRSSYESCGRYKDEGVILMRGEGLEYVRFRTRYGPAGEFAFLFGNSDDPLEEWTSIEGTDEEAQRELFIARGVSGGASTRVPGTFLAKRLVPYSIPHRESGRFLSNTSRGQDLILVSQVMLDEVREESWYFVDRRTYLLRGVVVRYYEGDDLDIEMATTYLARCEPAAGSDER
jgi:hypothetical protein